MFNHVAAFRPWPLRVCAVLATALAASSACGSSISPSTFQEFTGTLAEFTLKHHDFRAGKAGVPTIRLTWTSADVYLELDVRGTSCSDEQFFEQLEEGSHSGNACNIPFGYSGSGDEKSRELTLDAVKKDEEIRIFITNYGPGSQDYKVTVNIG